MRVKLRLQKHNRSRFYELKFISINIFSVELFGLHSLKSFEGISSLINNIMPPPQSFLSSQDGELKPSLPNWLNGKDESTFVSEITKMSNLLRTNFVAFQICF